MLRVDPPKIDSSLIRYVPKKYASLHPVTRIHGISCKKLILDKEPNILTYKNIRQSCQIVFKHVRTLICDTESNCRSKYIKLLLSKLNCLRVIMGGRPYFLARKRIHYTFLRLYRIKSSITSFS